jgi:flagellar hook assembly protein FlgD
MFGATTFEFAVPLRAAVSLDIFDLRGRRVYTVYREETEPGIKTIAWHGRNERGEPLASGQYLARLRVQGPGVRELLTRKITVLK